MNLWDYSIWHFILQMAVVLVSILFGNLLRRKIKFIKSSLLPASVIGGILIFIFKFIPVVGDFIDEGFMETLTYHCLGLGFVAMTLKAGKSKKTDKMTIVDCGITTVNGYLIQALIGLVVSVGFTLTFFPDLFYAAGLLLPMGFGQGTGQALNIGKVYESMGFENGSGFGLSIAAIGFLVACIVGVIYLNILRKRGKLELQKQRKEIANELNSDIYVANEAPLNDSVDKFTVQLAFVFGVYLITYLFILGLSSLAVNYLGNFGVNTIRPLLWGFNFLFGTIFAILTKLVMNKLQKHRIFKHVHINSYMMSRLSGFFFDAMIVAGIAAINYQELKGLLVPLIVMCILGAIGTFVYIRFVCEKIYPEYKYEAFCSIFGMLTGTASTGMILLREIDPNYETPAADNLVFQQIPAIVFGAPILLLIPFAGQNFNNCLIVLAIVVILFIGYNLFLFRKQVFKKRKKKE